MGRQVVKFDADTVATRIKLGYAQGSSPDYKPWLTFRDISIRGILTRLASLKLARPVPAARDGSELILIVAVPIRFVHVKWCLLHTSNGG